VSITSQTPPNPKPPKPRLFAKCFFTRFRQTVKRVIVIGFGFWVRVGRVGNTAFIGNVLSFMNSRPYE
jgi:hypothetical protein